MRRNGIYRLLIEYTELNRSLPLSAGDKLGPYEILAQIGAGGISEAYSESGHQEPAALALRRVSCPLI
jgi:hypothetical protein